MVMGDMVMGYGDGMLLVIYTYTRRSHEIILMLNFVGDGRPLAYLTGLNLTLNSCASWLRQIRSTSFSCFEVQ